MRVVVAEDSVLLREGLVRLLREFGFEVVGQARDAAELLRCVREARPDLAIVDIRMPPTQTHEGLEAAEAIGREAPDTAVLVLSHHLESRFAIRLLTGRPRSVGYLLKDSVADLELFRDALRRVVAGETVVDAAVVAQLVDRQAVSDPVAELTDREREILALIAEGRSNRAICERLFITEKTLDTHVGRIFAKLGLFPAPDDHRRVLAVLTYLRSRALGAAP